MGKKTVKEIGTIKIKMDTKDDVYFDAKEPHISFERNGRIILKHLTLSEVDNVVGNDPDEKKAIYWVRENKSYLIDEYIKNNRWFYICLIGVLDEHKNY